MKLDFIEGSSPYLKDIKKLWRENSQTLGFFPEGAFDDHAEKRCILAAISDSGELLGYLLFREVWRGSIWPIGVIVHLCVTEGDRGNGVCKALVYELRRLKKETYLKLELKCRKDYKANVIWPKLGFVYSDERTGRIGQPLIKWELRFRELPLINIIENNLSRDQLQVVIDANVLYRLQDPLPDYRLSDKWLSEEAKALEADWLDGITIFITDETPNEIQKNKNQIEREKRLIFANEYSRLHTDLTEVEKIGSELEQFYPGNLSRSMKSDKKQLSHAIAGNADFFVTQDEGILRKSLVINEKFGIRILSPGELIGRLDEAIREREYRPKMFAGSRRLSISKVTSPEVAFLYSDFRQSVIGEKKRNFTKIIRTFIAQPRQYSVEVVTCSNPEQNLAFVVYDRTNLDELKVPILRISKSNRSETVLRYLLRRTVLIAAREKRSVLSIHDFTLSSHFENAFIGSGFVQAEHRLWLKFTIAEADSGLGLKKILLDIKLKKPAYQKVLNTLVEELSKALERQDSATLTEIERRLWPAKILDANIPGYIISIHPNWAQHLFEEDLASQTFWGSEENLTLMNENVYYRSKRPNKRIMSPARILWYVKRSNKHQGTMSIRACSLLDEVIIGSARTLFRRFERLGVYRWEDIIRTAKDNPDASIMAIRFSNTELFNNPVYVKTLKSLFLRNERKNIVLQSPQLINRKTFAEIYCLGTKEVE